MKCLSCLHPDTRVTDSRIVGDGLAIRRRRVCEKCGFRFSTYEEPEILNLTVVKRNGMREPYSRDKMENGIRKSFQKRPITEDNFKRLISSMERDIQMTGNQEVTSNQIGEIVMKHLKRIDDVAYIRFASVYRSFKDADSFRRELKLLVGKGKGRKLSHKPSKKTSKRKK